MGYKIIVTEYAEIDAYEAYEWYEQKKKGLGEDFLFEIEKSYNKIVKNPTFYSYIDDKKVLRDLHCIRFPFVIVYSITGNVIVIISIHHTKKHPEKKYGIS